MAIVYTPSEIQAIKHFIGGLLDNSITPPHLDYRAIKAVFWGKLRAHLAANEHTHGLEHLDTLVQSVLDNDPDAALSGTVVLVPPPSASSQSSSALSIHRLSRSKEGQEAAHNPTFSNPIAPSTPIQMRLSSSCPKRVREAISAVLAKAAVQNKKPWQLAYPWAGRRLWYDPIGWEDIYRAHWRLYMEFRPAFGSWAFHAPLESTDSITRLNLMSRACCARLQFISLCIETWGYYDFCKRLDDNDDQFWYGGIPVKGSSQARTDSNEYAEDLAALYHTRKPRYKFIMDHALDPSYIDDFGYNNVRHLLESTGALDPTADPESRLSLRALAQIRRDMFSGTAVPAEWVGDINVDPWKALKESDVIKKQQERNTDEIMKGTYDFPRTTNLTSSELEAEDVSDNEDDGGIPTAIYIVDDDEDGPKKKKNRSPKLS